MKLKKLFSSLALALLVFVAGTSLVTANAQESTGSEGVVTESGSEISGSIGVTEDVAHAIEVINNVNANKNFMIGKRYFSYALQNLYTLSFNSINLVMGASYLLSFSSLSYILSTIFKCFMHSSSFFRPFL